MIKSERNTSLDRRDAQSLFLHSKETTLMCRDSERRNAVRKSKSVGYDTALGLRVWSEMSGGNEATIHSPAFSTDYHNSSIESRTVKSDTCLSPTKQRNVDLIQQSDDYASKKSPASVIDSDKQFSLHRTFSDKTSLSNHGSSVLEILSGYSNSHRATFNLSSCFSNDDESDGSSFAEDDILSLPATIRLSNGSVSMPSELTISQSLDTFSPQSKPEDRRKVTHSMSQMSTDVRPRPPRRKHSDKEFSVASLSKSLVPKQIQCFPMDESPMKPSRQVSVSKLLDGSGSSLFTRVSSIDLSPKKPKRYNSDDSETSFIAQSGLSVDSLPQKPQRQESMTSLTNTVNESNMVTNVKSQSNPPIRKVYRSESRLQPMLPTLSRRTGMREMMRNSAADGSTP